MVSLESRGFAEEKSLEYYYREVDRYPQVSAGEERALAARIERGDEQALDRLVKANLRFVIHVARGFQNQGLSMADLINEGNFGLVTAARKFNPRKGCKFITYAVWWIRQNILKALEVQTRTIRVPSNVLNDFNRLRRVEGRLTQGLERQPSLEEVAAEARFRTGKAARTMDATANTVSLDSSFSEADEAGPGGSFPDPGAPAPDEVLIEASMRRDVTRAVHALSDRHREVLSLYFGMEGGEPATYQQIGLELGISRERVRQLKEDALKRLRQPGTGRRLASYL